MPSARTRACAMALTLVPAAASADPTAEDFQDRAAIGHCSNRSRFEERFIGQPDTTYRFRQMFTLAYPLPLAQDFSLVGRDEVFVNLNNSGTVHAGLDQNRLFAGLGYTFDEHIPAQLGYMNQYIQKLEAADRISHILSLSLFLNY